MKRLHYILYIGACMILLFLGCTPSDVTETGKSEIKAKTITLQVKTRATGSDYSQGEESIKTLRVITATSNRTIVGSYYEDFFQDPTSSGSINTVTNITMEDIPFGEVTFYVVANEASVGLDLGGMVKGAQLPSVDEWEQKVVMAQKEEMDGEIITYFPRLRRDIGEWGLPITAIHTETIDNTTQNITIEITRAVAKIAMSFNNYANADIPIASLGLGQFIADRTFLFPQETTGNSVSIPNGNTYTDYIFVAASEEGATILEGTYDNTSDQGYAPQNKDLLVFYFYETNNTISPSPYTLGIETVASGIFMPPQEFIADQIISRNTQVDVEVNIYRHSDTEEIEWEVVPFAPVNVEVPEFD